MNNALLTDKEFNYSIKNLIGEIFTDLSEGCKEKLEFFKYETRHIAIKRCKMLRTTKENITEKEKSYR